MDQDPFAVRSQDKWEPFSLSSYDRNPLTLASTSGPRDSGKATGGLGTDGYQTTPAPATRPWDELDRAGVTPYSSTLRKPVLPIIPEEDAPRATPFGGPTTRSSTEARDAVQLQTMVHKLDDLDHPGKIRQWIQKYCALIPPVSQRPELFGYHNGTHQWFTLPYALVHRGLIPSREASDARDLIERSSHEVFVNLMNRYLEAVDAAERFGSSTADLKTAIRSIVLPTISRSGREIQQWCSALVQIASSTRVRDLSQEDTNALKRIIVGNMNAGHVKRNYVLQQFASNLTSQPTSLLTFIDAIQRHDDVTFHLPLQHQENPGFQTYTHCDDQGIPFAMESVGGAEVDTQLNALLKKLRPDFLRHFEKVRQGKRTPSPLRTTASMTTAVIKTSVATTMDATAMTRIVASAAVAPGIATLAPLATTVTIPTAGTRRGSPPAVTRMARIPNVHVPTTLMTTVVIAAAAGTVRAIAT